MKKKISAVLAMVLACSSLPIGVQANAENAYYSWCDAFCSQLETDASFVVTGTCEGAFERIYAVRGLQKGYPWEGTMYFHEVNKDVKLEGKDELEVGDIFYVPKEWLMVAEIYPGCIEIQNELFYENVEEIPELELKYVANGIELWGDSFVEALHNELTWERKLSYGYDIGILATEDNIINDIKPEPVLPPARPTGNEEQDNSNAYEIKRIANKLEYYKNLEIVLDDDGYVMFDDDDNVICTDGKHLMTYSGSKGVFIYTDESGENIIVDKGKYWKCISESERISYCVTDDGTPILNDKGEIDYYLRREDLLKDEGTGVYSYMDDNGETVYTQGKSYCGKLLTWKTEIERLAVWEGELIDFIPKKQMTDAEILKGDATEDGEVDILDVITVNKSILGQKIMSSSALKASDIDGDGIVSPNDSLAIMTYIVGLIDEL
ncbi:MAG: dockerin type I repeat-containing protein [Oscillospiraceae bacterium]|nr:dockerin type I repeat-containing protein [Oscillospiraceae bacterium]